MDPDTINAILQIVKDSYGAAAAGAFVVIATALKGIVSLWQTAGWQAFLGKLSPKLLWANWKPWLKAVFVGGLSTLIAVFGAIAAGQGWLAVIVAGLSAGVVGAIGSMGVNAIADAALAKPETPANP